MYLFGRLLGWLIVTCFTLTVLNYFVKRINRRFISKLPKDSEIRLKFSVFMRFIVKNHRYFAMMTTLALITHFVIQYLSWGFYPTGVIAGSLMIGQGAVGAFGTYAKGKKPGPWLYLHRTIAVLLTVAILLHILTVKFALFV